MAADAATRLEEPRSRFRRGDVVVGFGRLGQPGLESPRRVDDDLGHHGRMAGPAVLRAGQDVLPRDGGAKPHLVVAARNHVLLHPEGRDVEAVDDVLRGEDDLYRPVDRHVEIAVGVAVGIGELPGPLLGRGQDLVGVLGRGRDVHVPLEPEEEDDRDQDKRDQGPGQLQRGVVDHVPLGRNPLPAPVAQDEVDHEEHDEEEEDGRDRENEIEEAIDGGSRARTLHGKPEGRITLSPQSSGEDAFQDSQKTQSRHECAPASMRRRRRLVSRIQSTERSAPSATAVAPPTRRTMFMAVGA